MLLQEFVQRTLTQISSAVKASSTKDLEFYVDMQNGKGIVFDVAVETARSTKVKGGVGIKVLGASGGIGKKNKQSHRITFTVQYRTRKDGTIVSKEVETKK